MGLPEYEVTGIEEIAGRVRISVRFTGAVCCPHCGGRQLRLKDRRMRRLRHESWGMRQVLLELETRKWRCLECERSFWQRFPGILPRLRASEPFRAASVRSTSMASAAAGWRRRERISSATVERWFGDYLELLAAERTSPRVPAGAGHRRAFLHPPEGYATTFCDLKNHKIHDVVLGPQRSFAGRLSGTDSKARIW